MAEQIIKWKANDGSEWNDEAKASERDRLLLAVKVAMSSLGERYDDGSCDYSNGRGYVQHTKDAVESARRALYELTKPHIECVLKIQRDKRGKTDEWLAIHGCPGWFGRMLDGACRPLENAWGRIYCIDSDFREWGHPFFTTHQNEATQVRLR